MGLVAPWHVGSSQTRARTRVPCIGRQIPNHCTTREAPADLLERRSVGRQDRACVWRGCGMQASKRGGEGEDKCEKL